MFPRRSKDQKSTPVNVSTYSTQRRDKKKMKMRTTYPAAQHDKNPYTESGQTLQGSSRLYGSRLLQVNTQIAALIGFKIYKICFLPLHLGLQLLHRSTLNISQN